LLLLRDPLEKGEDIKSPIEVIASKACQFTASLYLRGVTRSRKPKNPIARTYYLKKLTEGKTKRQAILNRRLCDIIYAMMRDKSKYVMPQPKEYSILLTADAAVSRL